jgi:cyclophilin family peptidyl-prolyl cis-trans isomerase
MIDLARYAVLFMACLLWTLPAAAQEEESGSTEAVQNQQEEKSAAGQQEETATGEGEMQDAETPTPDNSFAGLLQKYDELSARLDEIKRQFDEAETPEASSEFRDQYARLVDEANLLIEEIRVTGLAVLDEPGDTDQKVLETLTGIVINDAFFDRDVEALTLGQKLIDHGIDVEYFEKAATVERLRPSGKEILRELVLRCQESAADDLPLVRLTTSKGEIVLELFENEAPETVANFISLVKDGFYDGLTFHRVLEGFMAQGGCPNGDGTGGPGYNIRCECYKPEYRRHFTGSLSMAKGRARNTGGSQFFLTFRRTSELDGKHTVFGRVIEGMDVVNSLQRIDPDAPAVEIQPDTIEKAEVLRDRGHEYAPTRVGG